MRELKKPEVLQARPADIRNRPNCKFGRTCSRQDSDNHAKKYNHICNALPEDQARTLHQDDSMPPRERVPEPDTSSAAESDEGVSSEDENDNVPSTTDAGTQWEARAIGIEVVCPTNGLNSAWLTNTGPTYPPPTSASTQAFSIASIVNGDAGPSSSAADTQSRAAQAPTWQSAPASQSTILGLRSSHQPTHQPGNYPNLFDSVGGSMNLPLSSKLPPLQTGSKLPSLFDMPEASTSARKLDSSSMDVEQ